MFRECGLAHHAPAGLRADHLLRPAGARGRGNLRSQFDTDNLADDTWAEVKQYYVLLLAGHQQPELAESFFNTVSTRLLHRQYFHNDFIFVRPAVSTEHLDATPPSFRVYYPGTSPWKQVLRQVIIDLGLACGYQDIESDLQQVVDAAPGLFGPDTYRGMDCQVHVLRSLFSATRVPT